MTKTNYITENKTNFIYYYCKNHKQNTTNKKIKFKNNPCNGQIKYIIKEDKFYLIQTHNSICENIKETIFDNIADINENIMKYEDFKKYLIDYLNKNPLINFNSFNNLVLEFYLKNKFSFIANKNTFKNIFYQLRNNSKIFNSFSIFDIICTKDHTIYLKEVVHKYIYNSKGDAIYWHRHIIWMSNFNIKRIRFSNHYYLDGTYIATKEFYQLLILIYYDKNSNSKIPALYILIISKFENIYIIVLSSLRNIITSENSIKLNNITITLDFEEGLIQVLNKAFP